MNRKPGANFKNAKFDCSFLVATLDLWPMLDVRHARGSACGQGAVIVQVLKESQTRSSRRSPLKAVCRQQCLCQQRRAKHGCMRHLHEAASAAMFSATRCVKIASSKFHCCLIFIKLCVKAAKKGSRPWNSNTGRMRACVCRFALTAKYVFHILP